MKNRFNIDFFEFAFLVEACIPPRPIARTTFWHKVIDQHYFVLTPEERNRLYDWIVKDSTFQRGIERDNELCLIFEARYNPDNQYLLEVLSGEVFCFLYNGKYHTQINTWVDEQFIKNVKKINNEDNATRQTDVV
jgi:hypothetical protein